MFDYADRDGDGYRETPEGRPLVLEFNSTPTVRDKQIDELWKRSMDDIGLKLVVNKGRWQDHLKASNAGKLMIWQLGGRRRLPMPTPARELLRSQCGYKGNASFFKLDAYDRIYEKARIMPDGPERTRLYQELTASSSPTRPPSCRPIGCSPTCGIRG